MKKKSCGDCKWMIFEDYGYSNYTTEGTTCTCSIRKYPVEEFDHWYGEEKSLEYAEECDSFTRGYPVHIDVDYEDYDWNGDRDVIESYCDDPEVIAAVKKNCIM